jgi:hypothetical protein
MTCTSEGSLKPTLELADRPFSLNVSQFCGLCRPPGGPTSMPQTTSTQETAQDTEIVTGNTQISENVGDPKRTVSEDSSRSGPTTEDLAGGDTQVPNQNQPEMAVQTPLNPVETLAERMARRQAKVESDLRERETLMLGYVRHRFHPGYYARWKSEANEFFNQAVICRLRRHRHGKTPSKR